MREVLPGLVQVSRTRETAAGLVYKFWPEAEETPLAVLQFLTRHELCWGKVESLGDEQLVIAQDALFGATDRTIIVGATKDMEPLRRLATMWLESPKSFAQIVNERI